MSNIGIYNYRWLLQELVLRDLKIKYRKSVLGYLWSILNPLLMMIVLTIVFSSMFRFDIENYPVYLLTGQLIFNFFSDATTFAMNGILDGASLIRKVYLPKYIFPVSKVLSSFITMLFSLVALLIVMILTGVKFHFTLILAPVVLLYTLLFSVGVGLALSALVVYFRDIQHLYGVLLTVFMYLTPIFYPISMLPEWLVTYVSHQPIFQFINMFREIILYGSWPTLEDHLFCLMYGILSLIVGLWIFKYKEKDFILYI